MDFVGTDATFDERGDEIFIMRVKPKHFDILAKVFEHYILNGEVKQLSQHRAMKDLRFLQYFFEYIEAKGNTEEVLLSEDNNFQESPQKFRKVGMLYGSIDQEVPNVELVSAILGTGKYIQLCILTLSAYSSIVHYIKNYLYGGDVLHLFSGPLVVFSSGRKQNMYSFKLAVWWRGHVICCALF